MIKRIVYIGGFGHWLNVAEEFHHTEVESVGAAPAYAGDGFLLTEASLSARDSADHGGVPFRINKDGGGNE